MRPRKLTPLGKEIKRQLVEREMKACQLEMELGIPRKYLSDIMYGQRSGEKYIGIITSALGIDESRYIS